MMPVSEADREYLIRELGSVEQHLHLALQKAQAFRNPMLVSLILQAPEEVENARYQIPSPRRPHGSK